MREKKLVSIYRKRKSRITTDSQHNYPVKSNLIMQNFSAKEPNRVWASDITYVPTTDGWLYLATIIDLFSRKIVGWKIDKHMGTSLISEAFHMAFLNRKPKAGLIFHSDRGSQYASFEFQNLLQKHGVISSMSRKANCYDNAVSESFFKTLKTELLLNQINDKETTQHGIFLFIEGYFNRKRRHSSLSYLTPVDFELNFYLS